MPYSPLPVNSDADDRWAASRTLLPGNVLGKVWFSWATLSAFAAFANLFVILVIVTKPHLRRKQFNVLIIGLAIPDFVMSTCCGVTCGLSAHMGRWIGDAWHCELQAVYVTFGCVASIWMNVLISMQVRKMATSAKNMVPYRGKTSYKLVTNIAAVYSLALTFALVPLVESVPLKIDTHYGLFCVPLDYDGPSMIFFWSCFAPLVLLLPVFFVFWQFWCTYAIIKQGQIQFQEVHAIFAVFNRLLMVLVLIWIPTFFFACTISVPPLSVLSGTSAHMQGFVSAIIYSRKQDIWCEIQSLRVIPWSNSDRSDQQEYHNNSALAFEPDVASQPSQSSRCSLHSKLRRFLLALTRASRRSVSSGDNEEPDGSQISSASSRREAVSRILLREQTPMHVVPFADFVNHGELPRSSDGVHRDLLESDIVIFVSHRWWDASELRPDDAEGRKYQSLCQAIRALHSTHCHGRDDGDIVVWIDYACIDQDDVEGKTLGIASLASYVARCDFLLIPVFPSPADLKAFEEATHPIQLLNFGERAWCRLEVYTFLCVAEMMERPLHCFAHSCLEDQASKWSWCSWRAKRAPGSGLRRLGSCSTQGAGFSWKHLPSNGDLTSEEDRISIQSIEHDLREEYSRCVLQRALVTLQGAGLLRLSLEYKQFQCSDVPLLLQSLQAKEARSIRELSLRGNQFQSVGAAKLLGELSNLKELDLQENLLGEDGSEHLEKALVSIGTTCPRLLRFGKNRLGPDGAAKIIRVARHVEVLDVADNQLGVEGANKVCCGFEMDSAASVTSVRTKQRTIDVSHNGIEDDAAVRLLDSAPQGVVLILIGNPISQSSFARAAALQAASMV